MSQQLNAETCTNHPTRAAVEHCEVCGTPLCNFCLYYTDDGQRLCETHAREAHALGLGFNPPEVYADGLLSGQADATRHQKAILRGSPIIPAIKGAVSGPRIMYQANNMDLLAFVSMLTGIFGVIAICGGGVCLPPLGFLMSIFALMSAKDAVDSRRTRNQAIIGLIMSGIFFLGIAASIALCAWSVNSANNTPAYYNPTSPFGTPSPIPSRTRAPIQTLTPTPEEDVEDNPAAYLIDFGE